MNTQTSRHAKKVESVQRAVDGFYKNGSKVRIYHGSTTTTRSPNLDMSKVVDISGLNEILEINVQERWALVEPNVAMDQLVDATLAFGLVPAVVPELPAITVGGSVQGGAGESSSFKYGCFHEICEEYEVVLGDGTVVMASAHSNNDLFYHMPCTYGTMGIITQVKIKLVPSTTYINLSYVAVGSYAEATQTIEKYTSMQAIDFVDGIMFSATSGVIMVGVYADTSLPNFSTTHKFTDDWFYAHAQRVTRRGDEYQESMPIRDYLFRYDKGAFWVARNGFDMLNIPFNRMTRCVFSGLLKNRTLYTFLNAAKLSQSYLVQDVCIPSKNAVRALEWTDNQTAIFPLWLCPLKPDLKYPFSPNYVNDTMVINIGVWGILDTNYEVFLQKHQAFERAVKDFGGRKVLYGHVYAPAAKFWQSYDKNVYENTRLQLNANTIFPTLYEKVHVNERYKPSIGRGIWAVLKSLRI